MNWLQFWSSIVSSLAWPVCVVLVSLIFRKKLGDLLAKITKLELPGGISTEFGKGLANVEQANVSAALSHTEAGETHRIDATADVPGVASTVGIGTVAGAGESMPTNQDPVQDEHNLPERIDPLTQSSILSNWFSTITEADAHPTGVVMEAWKELEATIFRIASASLVSGKTLRFKIGDILTTVARLTDAGVFSQAEATAIYELRRLRNLAAHSTEPLNPTEARKFVWQARSLNYTLIGRGGAD
ncbi:hypothetical protein HD842_003058 [Massilia aurea]|jgi:hypothetical protein|uniref:DUF4145 domain-containing protein n=1 Tax=Massilia aurea TaxID=373040 RepID=A0A7W9X1V8_9BURK|nr:hypothetical protein [Massilia aurea]MBB6134900.1 hypothetical protein [Massilia aurea]